MSSESRYSSRDRKVVLCATAILAIVALYLTYGPDNGDPIDSATPTEPNAVDAARRTFTTIARNPSADDIDRIRAAAVSDDPAVRSLAMTALGRLDAHTDISLLARSLKTDPNPDVQASAALALGRLRHWESGPDLIDALDSPSPIVRTQAAAAIDKITQVMWGFHANDPKRHETIQKIRTWWPKHYAKHLER